MNITRENVVHPDASLRFLRLELQAFRGPHHRHRHCELTWVERGSGVRVVGDRAAPFRDGDLVLLGPQVPHHWTSLHRPAQESSVVSVVQFEPALLDGRALPELRAVGLALVPAARGLAVGGATHRDVTRMLAEMNAADPVQRLALLLSLLGRLARGRRDLTPIATRPAAQERDASPRRDAVIDWIQAHLGREITVAAAARQAHVSPAAFSRWFRREVGRGFTDYVNDLRCSAACDRLLRTAAPVARIAADCGFATLSNFNLQFRRRYDATPREFRARHLAA